MTVRFISAVSSWPSRAQTLATRANQGFRSRPSVTPNVYTGKKSVFPRAPSMSRVAPEDTPGKKAEMSWVTVVMLPSVSSADGESCFS
jgi:hypothetical protein